MNELCDPAFIEGVWNAMSDERFSMEELVGGLVSDFGADRGSVEKADLLAIAAGREVDNWSDVAFACDEALACYSGYPLSRPEFFRALCATGCYLEGVKRGHGDIVFLVDVAGEILFSNRKHVRQETRVHVLRLVLRDY